MRQSVERGEHYEIYLLRAVHVAHHRARLPPFSLGAGLGCFQIEKEGRKIYRQIVVRTPGIGGLTGNSLHVCLVAGMERLLHHVPWNL